MKECHSLSVRRLRILECENFFSVRFVLSTQHSSTGLYRLKTASLDILVARASASLAFVVFCLLYIM